MTSLKYLQDQINHLASTGLLAKKGSTFHRLGVLADGGFSEHSDKELDFFSKKYDVSGKLFACYNHKGQKLGDALLDQAGLQIFASLLYLRVLLAKDQGAPATQWAKYINVCWKAFDQIQLPEFLSDERKSLKCLQDELFKQLPGSYKQTPTSDTATTPQVDWRGFKTLPIDVLFYEGPIARAYLEMLYSLRCKPRRIIQLIASYDLVTRKPVGPYLPAFLRNKYAAAIQSQKIHHWPRHLFRTHKSLCMEVFESLQATLNIEQSTLLGAVNLKPLTHYCDHVISLPVASLKDSNLSDLIGKQGRSIYLFTGGGILPKECLNIKNAQFLHIHPGYLPDIRGADCFLWSSMLTGRPSASCFFMDAGIDTGSIIHAAFLPQIKLPAAASKLDDKMIYRLLYSFIDPWVRSAVLKDSLGATDYLEKIKSTPQPIEAGTTFHFMHTAIKNKVINNLF